MVIIIDKYEYNIQLGWIAKLLHYIIGVKLYYYMILTMLIILMLAIAIIAVILLAIIIIIGKYNYNI